jgi:hypothetical protein
MKNLLLIICFLFVSVNAFADATFTAASCSETDIKSKLTEASSSSGVVVVNIPGGSETCIHTNKSAIPVNMVSGFANVTSLIIQGDNPTTIDNSAEFNYGRPNTFIVTASLNKKIRITGFKFTGSSGVYITGNTSPVSPNTGGFRIDHNIWDNQTTTNGRGIFIAGTGKTWGVIDSNTIDWNYQFSNVTGASTSYYGGNVAWNGSNPLGTAAAVYFEGNTATNHNLYNWMFVDTDSGASVVTRYNTLVNFHVMGHDNASQAVRGQQTWEHYNNDVTSNYGSDGSSMSVINALGGSGVIFNNIIRRTSATYAFAFPGTKGIALRGSRLGSCAGAARTAPWTFDTDCNSNTPRYLCFGTHAGVGTTSCDPESPTACNSNPSECQRTDGTGVTGAAGYPCRDQIGVDNNLNPRPALLWNNTFIRATNAPVQAVAEVASCAANYIVKDRDYCEHASTMPATCNDVETTYTAYTCPHPLADPSAQGDCTTSTAGETGYTLTGSEGDETAPTVTTVYVNGATMTINFDEPITSADNAAFTLDPSGTDVTVDCPAVATGATSMACTISRALVQSETAKYAYTDTKVVDAATNPLANIGATDITGNLTPAEAPTSKLTVNKTGSGCTVTSSPSGISVSGTTASDTFDFNTGTTVTLGGYSENGWNAITYGGDCAANGTVTMNAAKECTATCTQVYLFP